MNKSKSQITLISAVALAYTLIYNLPILAVVLPPIQKSFSATTGQVLWVVNISMLMRAMLVFASGRLSDIFSHRRTFIFGLTLFTLASFGSALAPNIHLLILFRCIQGIGAMFIFVPGMSLLTSEFPGEQRGRVIGIVLSVGLTSMAVGPVWGGIIIHYSSWRWIFALNAMVSLIALWIAIKGLKQTSKRGITGKFDWIGFLLTAIFTACTTLAFNNSSTWGWDSNKFILTATLAVVALVLFFLVEPKQKAPLADLKLFAIPNFLPGTLVASFVHIGVIFIVFIGIFLQHGLGYSPLIAGCLLLPMVATGVIFANVGGYLVDKFGTRVPIIFGTGCITLGFLLTLLFFSHRSYSALLPVLVFSGIGCFMISGPVRTSILKQTPKDKYGMANAILTGMRSIIAVIGFAITSAIITNMEFAQAKAKLLAQIPSISMQQIHALLGILAHTAKSEAILTQFNPHQQKIIQQVVLSSYTNGFFWALIFVGSLMLISFILAVIFIKR